MRIITCITLLSLFIAASSAFYVPINTNQRPAYSFFRPLTSSSSPPSAATTDDADTTSATTTTSSTTEPPLIVNGQNIDLTPALIEYVNKRIGGTLGKLSSHGAVKESTVILSVSKNPKVKNGHRVEVLTNLKGTTIVCQNESPDMYTSIDSAAHALNRKLRKYKERRTAGWHGGANMGKDLLEALEALERVELPELKEEENEDDNDGFMMDDPEAPAITKVNSFDLEKSMSVEEAVFALDYVDHDFYVFKNQENDKITVVYKRNVGGIGLIEP